MRISDLFQETYTALSANKVRSGLTILGIVIGISSVITLVSIGQGAQGSIESNIQSLGANLLQVYPGVARGQGFSVSQGRGSATSLTLEDAEAIAEEVYGVKAVSPEVSTRQQVSAKGTNTNTSIVGVLPTYPAVRNLAVADGVFISDAHNSAGSKVAVIGPTVQTDLFGEGVSAVGQAIRINSLEFKIIGVTVSKGGSGFNNQDDMIYIPLLSAQRYITGNKSVNTISVQAENSEVMEEVELGMTAVLLTRHKINDPTLADFSILNQNDLIGAASSITETLTLLLAAIAGISLVVGGIGIMNMMLTTVTERTREIGLRKAIGATGRDISNQFLVEAVTLTLIGGIVGVLLGEVFSYALVKFGVLETSVSLTSVFLAFGVSAVIGIVFGWYPARRASKLNPIEALRYE